MASSSSSAVRELLAGYVGGRVAVDRLVPAIAAEFYRSADRRQRDALRPVMDVIERAAPGMVKLARADGAAGFDIGSAERPFPSEYEAALRRAAEAALEGAWGGAGGEAARAQAADRSEGDGFWSRLLGRVRRLFSVSN